MTEVSPNCQRWLALLEKWEGGYSDHANDRGGRTMYGITEWFLNALHKQNRFTYVRFATITKVQAAQIAHEEFWLAVRADEIEWPLCLALVDFSFNSDMSMVVKMLQRLVGAKPDGTIGNETLAAIRWAIAKRERGAAMLARELHDKRVDFLNDLIQRNATQNAFRKGWWRRTNRLAYELA